MSERIYYEGVHLSLSTIGHATSRDQIHFSNRKQFIVPEFDWEKFGCEDARITTLGSKYYIFYTALSNFPFNAPGIRSAVAITRDFKIIEKHLVTPFNSKGMTLFPEKIGGKYIALLTVNTDSPPSHVALATFDEETDMWNDDYWERWYSQLDNHVINIKRFEDDHIEGGAPPVKTKHGWLYVYSHIQHYGKSNVTFGIEALLLDLKDPTKIIGRTHGPIMAADETYERYGQVPNLIFPTGAVKVGKNIRIFYGASDTTSCMADLNLEGLTTYMKLGRQDPILNRAPNNPILSANPNQTWETRAVFNPAALDIGGKIHILYRAQGTDNTSVIGCAVSRDGINIDERLPIPVYVPRVDFETKKMPGGNSGCEDPRLSKIGDTIYMCYTAYNGIDPASVAITHISVQNFTIHNWDWSEPVIITPEHVDDKDACLLPEKVNGRFLIFHRIEGVISADFVDDLNFIHKRLQNHIQILAPRPGMLDSTLVGIAAPPIKTKLGWIMLYHGVSEHNTYRMGVALLDPKNPTQVIARGAVPLLEPREKYEREGQIPNVVFPCGAVLRKNTLYIYYGGADTTVAVATVNLPKLLKGLLD